jgi:hypothetical protein
MIPNIKKQYSISEYIDNVPQKYILHRWLYFLSIKRAEYVDPVAVHRTITPNYEVATLSMNPDDPNDLYTFAREVSYPTITCKQ